MENLCHTRAWGLTRLQYSEAIISLTFGGLAQLVKRLATVSEGSGAWPMGAGAQLRNNATVFALLDLRVARITT